MKRPSSFASSVVALLAITGCGGGSSDSSVAAGTDTPTSSVGLPVDVGNGFFNSASRAFDEDGALVFSSETRIGPNGRQLLERSRADGDGGDTVVADTVIDLDEGGRATRIVSSEFVEGDPLSSFETTAEYRHDDRGRLLSVTRGDDGFEAPRVETLEWREGRLLRNSRDAGEFLGFEIVYEYDEGHLPRASRYTFWDGEPSESDDSFTEPELVPLTTAYTYDWESEGRLLALRVDEDADGTIDSIRTYEYDANGNVISQTTTDTGGGVVFVREFDWSAADAPVYNRWLRVFRYFP